MSGSAYGMRRVYVENVLLNQPSRWERLARMDGGYI
jgi:hypothetical protein